MKNNFSYFLMLSLVLSIAAKKSLRTTTLEGFSSAQEQKEALTFSEGTNGGHNLKDDSNYRNPTVVSDLSKEKLSSWQEEKTEAIPDEKESVKTYYDGESKLNAIKVVCDFYNSPRSCTSVSHCGWCGSSNKCVDGNVKGPLTRCDSKYSYRVNK